MHEVLVNRLGGLSLPRKSVDRLTDRLDMTLDVYRGCKTTLKQQLQHSLYTSIRSECNFTSLGGNIRAQRACGFVKIICRSIFCLVSYVLVPITFGKNDTGNSDLPFVVVFRFS